VQLVAVHQSCGGMVGDNSQSYTATILSAAKVISLAPVSACLHGLVVVMPTEHAACLLALVWLSELLVHMF